MSDRLKNITDPEDIRGLTIAELKEVCEEIRDEILRVMSANSGHLASSLGAVELAVALHYLYDTPRDRFVWDVGHQAYAHKILTGRLDRFHTIRQEGGLSGFLKRSESPYDAFGAGHASTSISAALGMALARDTRGEDYRVVAITGDGAMTGGPCYEALNHAGNAKAGMLVVFNDNEMSISKNTGALARTFNKIVMTPFYNSRHREFADFVKRLPAGESMARLGHRVEETVKGFILPGIFFEELGFRYLGPIDGHNLDDLVPALEKLRDLDGPILLHVKTVKGKGRPYSEADPIKWHSPPVNFDLATGKAPRKKKSAPSNSVVFVDALREVAREDENVVAVTAAMLEGTSLTGFEKEFPERTFDVGIAEAHGVMCAAGMACDGVRPFVCIYSTFLQRAIDSVIHDVGIQKLPVIFSLDRAGLVGADGPTHHGVFDLTYMRMIPNMIVMAPKDARELRRMTFAAHSYSDGPVTLRFARGSAGGDYDPAKQYEPLEIGKAEVLREGDKVCLLGIGNMVGQAEAAADELAEGGVEVGVVNARFVKPLDTDLIEKLARQYDHIVTIEDHVRAGGFGSAVAEALSEMGAKCGLHILGVPDRFIEHGSQASLYDKCGISGAKIAEKVRELVPSKSPASKASVKSNGGAAAGGNGVKTPSRSTKSKKALSS